MEINDSSLPPEINQLLQASLAENGLPENDPLALMIKIQARMIELIGRRRRKRLMLYSLAMILMAGLLGYLGGYISAWHDSGKARPLITMTSVGGGILYGTQSGRDVIAISSGNRHIEDAWKNGETAYVLVK